jgi:predicted ATPase/class 3 adenylate cyclase
MLFSDIEGSTRLLSRMGDRYGEALDRHRTLLRASWRQWAGVELGTDGDSFFVVFEAAGQAVAAALGAQQSLVAQTWPGGQRLSVRMGLHTGEPVPHGDGYVGMDVHRAARIAAAANGGQIVISDVTQRLVREDLDDAVSITDLGWHRLKNFVDPTHLYQLTAAGMPETFPPLRTFGTTATLPVQPTPLLGREQELREMSDLLADGARLITLTGVGGVGKSRLAVALAEDEAAAFPDGVYFVPLVEASAADDMWSELRKAVGASGSTGSPRELVAQLTGRHMLLVLDNLEQITDADRVVNELLTGVPELVVVATSRRPLHLRAEHDHPVRPLPVPELDETADVEESAAVQMFCLHARMVRPDFALTAENASAVAAICRRLDGLPLALELAAARSKLLTPGALLARTTSSADLAAPAADRPERHHTLRDTIAWSYDLLPAESRSRFRRLGVFCGGADLDAVAAVALPTPGGDPLDTITELVDASLVGVAEGFAGELRVELLQTVADFAVSELAEAGELADTRDRHAGHFLDLARALTPQIWTGQAPSARQRLHDEAGNFRTALTWTLRPGPNPEPDHALLGLQLCAALGWFWLMEGQFAPEVNRWFQQALELVPVDCPERVTVLCHLATNKQGGRADDPSRMGLLEDALAVSRRIGDAGGECDALRGMAEERYYSGDPEAAESLAERATALAEQLHDPVRRLLCIHAEGLAAQLGERHGMAIERFTAARDLARARGDEAFAANNEAWLAQSLALAGRLDEATQTLRRVAADALRISQSNLNINITATGAHLCAALGAAEPAATLLGANWSYWTRAGNDFDPAVEEEWMRRIGLTDVRDALGQQQWEQALHVGSTLTLEDAVALLP